MKAFLVVLVATLLAPSLAAASSRCYETSPSRAVGLARCRRFGWGWDHHQNPFWPTIEVGLGTHVYGLPGTLSLCDQVGKACNRVGSMPTGRWGSAPVVMVAPEITMTVLSIGPMRAGLSFQFGGGAGSHETTPVSAANVVGNSAHAGAWGGGSGSLVLGVRAGRGPWHFSMDVRPGLVTLSTGAHGLTGNDRNTLNASAGGLELGGRLGAGYFVTPFTMVGLYAGAGIGSVREASAGLLVRFTFSAFDRTH